MTKRASEDSKFALIVGGNGQLGQAVVKAFNSAGYSTLSADLFSNDEASHNVVLKGEAESDAKAVLQYLSKNDIGKCFCGPAQPLRATFRFWNVLSATFVAATLSSICISLF